MHSFLGLPLGCDCGQKQVAVPRESRRQRAFLPHRVLLQKRSLVNQIPGDIKEIKILLAFGDGSKALGA